MIKVLGLLEIVQQAACLASQPRVTSTHLLLLLQVVTILASTSELIDSYNRCIIIAPTGNKVLNVLEVVAA